MYAKTITVVAEVAVIDILEEAVRGPKKSFIIPTPLEKDQDLDLEEGGEVNHGLERIEKGKGGK